MCVLKILPKRKYMYIWGRGIFNIYTHEYTYVNIANKVNVLV